MCHHYIFIAFHNCNIYLFIGTSSLLVIYNKCASSHMDCLKIGKLLPPRREERRFQETLSKLFPLRMEEECFQRPLVVLRLAGETSAFTNSVILPLAEGGVPPQTLVISSRVTCFSCFLWHCPSRHGYLSSQGIASRDMVILHLTAWPLATWFFLVAQFLHPSRHFPSRHVCPTSHGIAPRSMFSSPLTALHVAAWLNRLSQCCYLASHGISPHGIVPWPLTALPVTFQH